MTIALNPNFASVPTRILPEQRVILHNASWETYERLLAEHDQDSGTHFAFDQGMLEIFHLQASHYSEQPTSTMLPKVTGGVLTEFVESSQQLKRRE